jgi:hypothetical protein
MNEALNFKDYQTLTEASWEWKCSTDIARKWARDEVISTVFIDRRYWVHRDEVARQAEILRRRSLA